MRRRAKDKLALMVILTGLLGCTNDRPAPVVPAPIGTVIAANGSPGLTRKNRDYLLGERSRLFEGDIVMTDGASIVHLTLEDTSRIELGPDSRLVLHEFRPPHARIALTAGSIRAAPASPADGKRLRLTVQTPVARIESRGSEFVAGIGEANTLDIAVLAGSSIDIANDHGSVQLSASGEGTSVIGGTAPQPGRPWTPGKLDRVLAGTSIGDRP